MKEFDPSQFDRNLCPIIHAIAVTGDKWTLLILREGFMGFKRFEEFEEHLGISRSVLSRRLKTMIRDGLLYKKEYSTSGERDRMEYRLTKKGWEFIKVMIALIEWSNEHLIDTGKETLKVVERQSDQPVWLGLTDVSGRRVDWYGLELKIDTND